MKNLLNAYQIKWTCFYFESKKRVPNYVTKGCFAMVIGNLVLTHSASDVKRIKKNIIKTKSKNPKEFAITDKQFGLINLTNEPFVRWNMKKLESLKKCNLPHLVLNNNGNAAIVPVTNVQFMGTNTLNRKSFWM